MEEQEIYEQDQIPTELELHQLRRVPDKIPPKVLTIAYVGKLRRINTLSYSQTHVDSTVPSKRWQNVCRIMDAFRYDLLGAATRETENLCNESGVHQFHTAARTDSHWRCCRTKFRPGTAGCFRSGPASIYRALNVGLPNAADSQ